MPVSANQASADQVGAIQAGAYFDGQNLHGDGPYLIETAGGLIRAIHGPRGLRQRLPRIEGQVLQVPFLMPGLVDGHVHLFLDGGERNFARRAAHLKSDFASKMETARANVAATLRAGVSAVRDAGDRFGVNTAMRDALAGDTRHPLTIRSSGIGLKRPKRYGSFIARDLGQDETAGAAVADVARDSDDLKIILTGIIDFERGEVPGAPQFSVDELCQLVRAARQRGLKTLVHCSGLAGLQVAVAAGVGSIEHGFFMNRDILTQMADRQIAWVPTFSPVFFQWQQPQAAGWGRDTIANLRRILDNHHNHLGLADRLGVPIVAGSDAGSYGVDHGAALIAELRHMLASGLRLQAVLVAATSRPRTLWNMQSADIVAGNQIDVVGLNAAPFGGFEAFAKPAFSFKTSILMLN
jgi:imidazolonepropionase-like amidohydrolase